MAAQDDIFGVITPVPLFRCHEHDHTGRTNERKPVCYNWKMPKSNSRSHNRVTAFLPVTIATDRGTVLKGEIEDLSLGGASIRCVHTFSPGEKITVDLHFAGLKSKMGSIVEVDEIDDEGLIRASEMAEVRWQKGSAQVGIKFVSLKPETKKFLTRLVKFFERIKNEDLAG